jgi:hypothetical protein
LGKIAKAVSLFAFFCAKFTLMGIYNGETFLKTDETMALSDSLVPPASKKYILLSRGNLYDFVLHRHFSFYHRNSSSWARGTEAIPHFAFLRHCHVFYFRCKGRSGSAFYSFPHFSDMAAVVASNGDVYAKRCGANGKFVQKAWARPPMERAGRGNHYYCGKRKAGKISKHKQGGHHVLCLAVEVEKSVPILQKKYILLSRGKKNVGNPRWNHNHYIPGLGNMVSVAVPYVADANRLRNCAIDIAKSRSKEKRINGKKARWGGYGF